MADQLLEKVRDVAEGQIDFEGQKLAELLSTVLLAVVGVGTIPSRASWLRTNLSLGCRIWHWLCPPGHKTSPIR